MPVTSLDPNTALIIVDLQEFVRHLPLTSPVGEIFERASGLARAFRDRGLPVVVVNVEVDATAPRRKTDQPLSGVVFPPNYTDIVPEIDAQPGDIRITKHTWGAFHETGLHDRLKALGVTEVVVVGLVTSAGVEGTARAAHEHGYNVVVAIDAVADRDPVVHENSISRVFPRIGRTATTPQVFAALG